jgi:hypothetical protein
LKIKTKLEKKNEKLKKFIGGSYFNGDFNN